LVVLSEKGGVNSGEKKKLGGLGGTFLRERELRTDVDQMDAIWYR
jgi:hypothetical protein